MHIKRCAFLVMLCAALCSLGIVPSLWAGPITTLQSTIQDTWHSGASLINNASVLSSAVTLTNPGYREAWCTLDIPTTSVAVTAGTAVTVWFRVSTDGGTTYPDGDASTLPADLPSMTFPLRAVATRQVVPAFVPRMPTGTFKVLILNNGTGATLNATWTLKCKTQTPQS